MAVMWDLANDARVRREATALAAAGHQVTVVGFDYSVDRLTTRCDEGVNFVQLPFTSRNHSPARRVLGAAQFFLRASRAILATEADAYHSHNLHLALPCVISARRHHSQLVYDAHELVSTTGNRFSRFAAVPYERFVWRRAAGVITTNAFRADYLEKLHGDRPIVLGNYPDEPRGPIPFDLRQELEIPEGARILIYQGGFYLGARCFDTVAAALRSLPGWHWVLIGFGSAQTLVRLQQILEDAGVADRAHILPAVPANQLLHLTAAADVGIVPLTPVDTNNYYGDTNKLFEYLLGGVPAVGSDFPEIRRVILDNPVGPVGSVFDPSSPDSIASAIRDVEDDLETLRPRAREVGERYYSWRVEQAKLLDLYDGLGSDRSAAV